MSVTKLILCKCDMKYELVTSEGEIVCRSCGCVKGVVATSHTSKKSKTNLYQDLELGSKQIKSLENFKFHNPRSVELSVISNVCEALSFPQYFNHDVWYWYKKIRANIKYTKAKVMVLVFYQLCRYNEIPLDEKLLNAAIKSNLNTKNGYSSLKVICEANAFLDENGVPVLEKIGFNRLTKHNMNFLLRSKLKSLYGKYSADEIARIEGACHQIFPSITGTDEQVAKTTFKIAKERCGFC